MDARALVIQHFPADALGSLEGVMKAAHIRIDLRRTDNGNPLPENLNDHDALVVLGGPGSAAQQSRGYPSLEAELALVREAHERSKPALGICLGAQVIARAAGATVYPGSAGKEIGWMNVRLTDDALSDGPLVGLPREVTVLQWHGDTFDLPDGARLLATNDTYPNQAFQWGSCLALQPHLEIDTEDGVRTFIEVFPEEAALAVGGATAILNATAGSIQASALARASILETWVRTAAATKDHTWTL